MSPLDFVRQNCMARHQLLLNYSVHHSCGETRKHETKNELMDKTQARSPMHYYKYNN